MQILAPETRVLVRACEHVEPSPAVVVCHLGECEECGLPCYHVALQPSGTQFRCCKACLLVLN